MALGAARSDPIPQVNENIPAVYRFDQTTGNNAFADQGWWELYQDSTLQSLIREALKDNLDVRIAERRSGLALSAERNYSSYRRSRVRLPRSARVLPWYSELPAHPPLVMCLP